MLGSDVGLFVTDARQPGHRLRVAGVPNAVVDNVRLVPGTRTVLAAPTVAVSGP